MENTIVKILEGSVLPTYATEVSAGADLYAIIENPVLLQSLDRKTFPVKVNIALPEGKFAMVAPRSGLAREFGVVAVVGIIDGDYRGEIGVTLINLSKEDYKVLPNDRIAQLIVMPYDHAEWQEVEHLDETKRGTKGFGHSGR